jgi:energy-coupling factor transport system permease protein
VVFSLGKDGKYFFGGLFLMNKSHFGLRDVILLALIGIIFGVIYFAGDFVYNAVTLLLTPLGLGAAGNDFTMGLWCMAGPLAGFMLKRPGSAFLGEFLGAAGEMFLGGQWGAANLISGAVQGVATELGFTLVGYRFYNWVTILSTTLTTTIVTFAWDWFRNGYSHFALPILLACFAIRLISMFLFCGVLVKLITRLLERAHVIPNAQV